MRRLIFILVLLSAGPVAAQTQTTITTPGGGKDIGQQVDTMSATLSAIGASMRSIILGDQAQIAELQHQNGVLQDRVNDLQHQLDEAKKLAQAAPPPTPK